MYFHLIEQLALQQAFAVAVTASPMNKPIITPTTAMIYRGPSACEGCPETVETLLKEIYPNIHVIYAGPHEDTQINATTLRNVRVFAQGGGDDLNKAWEEAKPYASAVRDYVAGGGNYLGFCLGAFLTGSSPGFGLLSLGDNVVSEVDQDGAEIEDERDAIIEVDWAFSTGSKRGTTEHHRRVFFQDGAAFTLAKHSPATVLGRYSSNYDVAAILTPFGKGWVANIGPHPEADQSWYDDAEIENPEGVRHDIGRDFVQALFDKAL